jgi:hypothetical protein
VEGHLAGRLAGGTHHDERADAGAGRELVIDGHAALDDEGGVGRVDRDARPGGLAQPGRGPEVVPVGEEDPGDAAPTELRQLVGCGLDRIDRQVSPLVLDEGAVEVLAEALRARRPGEDAGDDLTHWRTSRRG